MMQDEFGYPIFSNGDSSPRNAGGYGKKQTLLRFTDDIVGKSVGGSSAADFNMLP